MLFAISGPSGVGKTTLCKGLMARQPALRLSVSHTTRAPRGKEQDGVHYYFTNDADFDAMVEAGGFAEHADVFGCKYGTARATLDAIQGAGDDVLLDIDYQGAEQLSHSYPDAVTVLLAPPSMAVIEDRLRGRATDSEQQIARRLAKARHELSQFRVFRYLVVNDDIEAAIGRLDAIYVAERARVGRQSEFLANLLGGSAN